MPTITELRARAIRTVRATRAHALDLLLPPLCMGCAAPTLVPFGLCATCFAQLTFITAPFCRCCGVPFVYPGQGGSQVRCQGCTDRSWHFGTVRGALQYDSASRALILRFKHGAETELAALFAPMMRRAGQPLLDRADLLVPVPLHRARLRARGFNQAALLAERLGRAAGKPILVDALMRARATERMGALGAAERAANLTQAITVRQRRASLLTGRRILLIDDVMTSGATLDACAAALQAAGASATDGLVAARVPDPRDANSRPGA